MVDPGGVGGGARTVRVLAALVLVLGLLGMHGLAGGHHDDSGSLPGAMAIAGATTANAATATLHAAHDMIGGAARHAGDTAARAAAACDPSCPTEGVVTLCLAVLSALALALLLFVGRPARRRLLPSRDAPSTPGGLRLRPPLDPVSELCVSRT